ncbi:MAG: hypothetical protein RLZZ455_1231 [Candidatus Parcubacteria bacterium]|jgi:glycosyltransferase involved in cell wall biosynthesis
MKIPTLTIGIPAFNEEENIARLMKALQEQKLDGIRLTEIIVASDGSTDSTVKAVRNLAFKNITLMANTRRRGRASVQNEILKAATSDYLVLIDADTAVIQKDFLMRLIRPLIEGFDLSAARIEEVTPSTIIEKILFASMQWKKELFESVKSGDNVYTCHGRARGFSKKLYKVIVFPHSVGEDAYSYFYCKKNKFLYKYVPSAKVYYRLPSQFVDHLSQSKRYFASRALFINEFGEKFMHEQYLLPPVLTVLLYLKTSFRNMWILLYFPLVAIIRIISALPHSNSNTWRIASTSKSMKGVL